MEIHLPDPYPGRCLNFRSRAAPGGRIETVRCLDYEGTEHVCTFPPFTYHPPIATAYASSVSTYTQEQPQPWVKP